MSAHSWLKYYVYLRQLDNKRKESFNFASTFITFTVSAIWHGFYPGYYVFFTGAALMDYHSKLAEKALAPYFSWLPFTVVRALSFLWCYLGCAYFSIGFSLLSFERFYPVYKQLYYYFHIVLIASLLFFLSIKPKRGPKPQKIE